MLPVVPKVKVGDVLFGTRHLREWIHTASHYYLIRAIYQDAPAPSFKIASPPRDCPFIVGANSGRHFFAWSPFENLALIFANHTDKGGERMRPNLFSHWFIRTQDKRPKLSDWPDWAFGMWANLQMGLCLHKDFRVALPSVASLPFVLHQLVKKPYPRRNAESAILGIAAQGLFRRRTHFPVVWPAGLGPLPNDAEIFRRELVTLSKSPLVSAFLKKNKKPGEQEIA